ncbi:sensor histidine kinase [Undibacterium jejuense]|uniref:sensor histidine kinase n=1 Tax=Undibacterium jejuense TaxID=1344949 RepID=UPI001FE346B8|nr:histidine kinase [Undibacterium jejuense]
MPTLTAVPTTRMSSTQIFSALLINLTIWFGICTVGAAGNFQDLLKEGRNLDFYRLWLSWVDNHVPLILMSSVLFITLRNCLSIINSAQKIARLYVGLALCFYPLHMFYNAASRTLRQSEELNWYNWMLSLATYDHFTWFLEFAWFTGTFAVVTAICIWHQGQERAAILQKAETANLNLHLALEQQRLRSIRQQLEPHFIFNALNAISALVRSNEKPIALSGIRQLSDLLRYALNASSKDWVRFSDELQFVRDYLALQNLRYGERLQVHIQGDSDTIMHGDCPPLLLQPLIENALRHDLDCHEQQCSIFLHFSLHGEQLRIHLKNSLGQQSTPNPGLGMGLGQTKTRLDLLYEGQAILHTKKTQEYFELTIHIPLQKPERIL